ncbi:MAG: UDP-N-acetylmuramoyl-L-alanine--D-glutamate ligase [Alphaproteobacteria bacterium]|nr:UDP-N-acetylmuramoyl-L-alanine--D-glutamate ligase [Alphaproteobacteria bacterium]
MIDLRPLKSKLGNKPVAVVGLGKSGLYTYEACTAAGIGTVLWDDNPAAVAEAKQKGAVTEDLTRADFTRFSLLCLAPGIPLTHPQPHATVLRARAAGCDIVCDIELFHRAYPKMKTIGITGTNGKSTTTALVGYILKVAGVEAAVGGNIGEASLSLPQLSGQATYVFELSSYQLDLCPTYAPDIAVLINLSPDHLDRHGGMDGYIAAKERIFRGPGVAIIGIDDAWAQGVYERLKKSGQRKIIPVSCLNTLEQGICVTEDGVLRHDGREIADLKPCRSLQGQHNWQNAAMAYAACLSNGVAAAHIIEGLKSFPGLAHRQNIVAVHNGVAYINDSKATNDQAAAMALRTYSPIYWIAGGKAKDGGYSDCEKYARHIRHAFLIGDAQEKMAAWAAAQKIPFTLSGTLDKALSQAHDMAQREKLKNAVVLLSPACASFDQFKNFEQRGDVFAALVRKIAP